MKNKEEFSERLKSALKEYCDIHNLKYSQTPLESLTGVSQPTVSSWLNADKMPGMANAVALAAGLGVTVEWLLTGRGQRYIDENTPPELPDIVITILDEITAFETEHNIKLTDEARMRWLRIAYRDLKTNPQYIKKTLIKKRIRQCYGQVA